MRCAYGFISRTRCDSVFSTSCQTAFGPSFGVALIASAMAVSNALRSNRNHRRLASAVVSTNLTAKVRWLASSNAKPDADTSSRARANALSISAFARSSASRVVNHSSIGLHASDRRPRSSGVQAMNGSLTLGILAAFIGFAAIVSGSFWFDRCAFPRLSAANALATTKAGEASSHIQQEQGHG